MMQNLFRWWQFVLIGMGIATFIWLLVFVLFIFGAVWAGWPRARERELQRDNDELYACIERLTAKGETEHDREAEQGNQRTASTGQRSVGDDR